MTELYNNQRNYTAAIEMAQSAVNLEYTAENNENKYFLKYISITQYLVAANQLLKYNYEDAMMAINQITYFQLLHADDKKRLTENGSYGYASGYNFINTIKTFNPGISSEAEIYAKAATALKNGNDTAENGTLHVFVQLKKLVTKPNSCYPKSKGKSQSQIIQSVLQPLFAKTQLHAFLMHIMTECQFFSSRFTNKIGKFWINLGIPAQLFWTRNQPVIKLLRKLKSLSCPTFQPPVLLRHVRNLR